MRTASASLSLLTKGLAVAFLAGFVLTTTAADAKPRKSAQTERSKSSSKTKKAAATRTIVQDDGGRWHYGSSAIVVDANTGRVLYEDDADALRHPASVTKVMTLYLLFEQIEAGRLKLSSDLPVSAKAAAQSPTKLGLRPGSTLEVEDAIKGIVTRSANDAAVVIAEALGGTESNFAEMMTQKARALGMSRTTFRNASGLPNPNQVTTARDLSVLGRAIQDRFPKEYRYFATRTFYFRGEAIGNHNRLVGSVEGVDGIKTGYTQASGFNLLTSLKRDDRYMVAVVLGGRSAGSRDARMRSLLAETLPRAYAGARTAPKITEDDDGPIAMVAPLSAPLPRAADREAIPVHDVAPLPKPQYAVLAPEPATTASIPTTGSVKSGSVAPIRPVAVKTVSIQRPVAASAAAPAVSAAASATAAARGFSNSAGVLGYMEPTAPAPAAQAVTTAAQGRARQPAPKPQTVADGSGEKDASRYAPPPRPTTMAERAAHVVAQETPMSAPMSAQAPARAAQPVAEKPIRTASIAPVAIPERSEKPATARSGWGIQIGAFGAEKEARAKLDLAQNKAHSVLGGADPYTEKTVKGSTALYRARFTGLDEKSAKAACRLLQRNAFACMTIKN
ncbi:D-alanyl-D-alanine carboxypeptidase [Xanthobacter agilis]|uniref:D-alanyl-D-alanine carboxypeptidase n=1 Tax=Xanthobacter agilis TaxID=47492 RepID=A0ABU0LCA8_XANAG|nr:D-alanyl-D-alanine carboxypeptidase [Xanthobacter agilis]MDQ0504792.1 D-alanyl-D-alanine carboxypeptidase [Xanthobacter agilis]